MKKENAEAKVSAIDLVKALSLLKDEMSKMKRQLRQRKALFNIFLTKMGGITFEFEIASDTAYFTEMGEDGTPKETVINNFRKWIYSHAENGVEFLLRLQRFVDTKGASVEEKNYGTLEWPAKINTEEFHWYKLDYQVVFDDNENVIAMIGYMQDIHEEYSKRLDLEQQAQRDSMTKLYNRATTERLINEQLATIKEREKGVLFLLDVDNFKQLNDNLGHLAGDKYLKGVSEAVSNAFRSSDVVGRIGGDEFVVFIKGSVSLDLIEKYGQRLINLFLRVPCKDGWQVSCSIGIAATGDSSMTYEKLLANADNAMYKAKARGKNRFYLYGIDDI